MLGRYVSLTSSGTGHCIDRHDPYQTFARLEPVDRFQGVAQEPSPPSVSPKEVTPEQRGPSVAEIAARLNIWQNTVKTHLRHVYAKTEVRGQAELAGLIASLKVMTDNGGAN
jgi:hypothetical protein